MISRLPYTKADFIDLWGDGYIDDRGIGDYIFENCIQPFVSDGVCLEIGCGGGFWANRYLKPHFGQVIGIDVIEKPATLEVEYHELPNQDYLCSPIASNSIDFVWCFDVFCHLPNSAVRVYLENIMRVLKPAGQAVISFPNWLTHPSLQYFGDPEQYRESPHDNDGWFYMDRQLVDDMLGGINATQLVPGFRDLILHLRPCA